MGFSKVAAILALALGLVAQAASANDRTLQVSAIILSKCSLDPAGKTPSATPVSLSCTGSNTATHYRVRGTTDTPAMDFAAPARRSQNDAVVTVEF